MLSGPADPGARAALDAALAGEPIPEPVVDPQPGNALPPPDSEQRAPEGDGATDPADNAPQPAEPKPDEHKTVEPTDPLADDPAVEVPGEDGGGPTKRPSDEFGELPKDVSAKTRDRFDSMRTKYDELHSRFEEAHGMEQKWVETVQSTGATPEQFGGALSYLKAVNSGTKEGMEQAYEMMSGELSVLAKQLGREVPGSYDPLTEHADLAQRVDDGLLERADALEIAQARAGRTLDSGVSAQRQEQASIQQQHEAALADVTSYGAQMKASDPQYGVKAQAIKPIVERVIAALPPAQWAQAIKEAYNAVTIAAPAPAPSITAPLRPTSTPGGNGVVKEPGNPREALDMALANLTRS